MCMYTTGELAGLCGVTVRTVQYYDGRGILSPSMHSEGGRRLYSEEDLRRLKIICFLREMGLPIESIRQLLHEEHPENVISGMLDEQARRLEGEIEERQARLERLSGLRSELHEISHFTVESIGDIAQILQNRAKLRRTHGIMLAAGVLMDIIENATLLLWILRGIWWPFAMGILAMIALGIWISAFYFCRTVYICPSCHRVFRPSLRRAFWAPHTPRARKLTCPHCGLHGFCVETYGRAIP